MSNSHHIQLLKLWSWFHATWVKKIMPLLLEGWGGEMRRGEEAAMAISITRVSENNGQIMTVKVVNVSLLHLFPSHCPLTGCKSDYSITYAHHVWSPL